MQKCLYCTMLPLSQCREVLTVAGSEECVVSGTSESMLKPRPGGSHVTGLTAACVCVLSYKTYTHSTYSTYNSVILILQCWIYYLSIIHRTTQTLSAGIWWDAKSTGIVDKVYFFSFYLFCLFYIAIYIKIHMDKCPVHMIELKRQLEESGKAKKK